MSHRWHRLHRWFRLTAKILGHTDYTDYTDWFFAGAKKCFRDVTNCVGGIL